MGFLSTLHGPLNPRPHGDGTPWGHTRWVTRWDSTKRRTTGWIKV